MQKAAPVTSAASNEHPLSSRPSSESLVLAEPTPRPPSKRSTQLRRLTSVMLVRVILFTILLGGTVAVHFILGTVGDLTGPHVTTLFGVIVLVYVLNIVYALLLRTVRNLNRMAVAQIIVDLLLAAFLVHVTGAPDSAFVLFFFLAPVSAALTLPRYSAAMTAVAGTALLIAVVLLGRFQLLPIISGQIHLPWEFSTLTVGRSLLLNSGVMFAVAALSEYLAEQLRSAETRVEAQQAHIEDLSALHSDMIRCLTSGLVTISTTGIVLSVNRAAAEMLGVDERAAFGRALPEIAPELAELIWNSDSMARRAEVRLERHGEARILGVSVSLLTDRDNLSLGQILNFQDLTTLRKMEQTIKRSEHMAALGRVAAGVAHEIRNPLASISGSLELLSSEERFEGDDAKLMKIALREIERLDTLINDLLNYARPTTTANMQPMDLGTEIQSLITSINDLMSAGDLPEVVVVSTQNGLWIKAQRERILALLWNLVRNASQAGEHERVEVMVRGASDERVSLLVRDRGRGIAPEDIDRIFEPFFTTKNEGSGLGLAIVHRTVQDHDGKIEIDSKVGQGTTVTVHFPRIPAPQPSVAPATNAESADPRRISET